MPKSYVLPEPHPELFRLALRAWRLAVQHHRRVYLKWEPRAEEIRKADEFSRLRRAWENDIYRAEEYRKYVQEVFLRIANGDHRWPDADPFLVDALKTSKDRGLLRVRQAVADTLALFQSIGPSRDPHP